MLCLSRAAHDFIFRSWSKRTTPNEAKTNTYAIFLFINAFLNERSRQAGRKSLRRLPARSETGRSVGSPGTKSRYLFAAALLRCPCRGGSHNARELCVRSGIAVDRSMGRDIELEPLDVPVERNGVRADIRRRR